VRIQRTNTILLPDDTDLRATLDAFQRVQQALSPICFNDGKPLPALALYRTAYRGVAGTLSSQVTIREFAARDQIRGRRGCER
jgi:hypothetical protein